MSRARVPGPDRRSLFLQENNSDHLSPRAPRLRPRHLGPASDYRPDERATELGDGVQEVPAGLQGTQLPWEHEAAQGAAPGLEQQVPLQRLHHVVHARVARLARLQAQKVVLHDSRRGAHDQELQVAAVEYPAHVSLVPEAVAHWDTTAE